MLMQDAEFMGQHYGSLYERYKHMEQKYKDRCNENAQLNLVDNFYDISNESNLLVLYLKELADCKSILMNHQSVLKKLQESAYQSQSENTQLRQNCSRLTWELDKTHDKIDVFRNAANENEKLYVECTKNSAQSVGKLKKDIEDWNDVLQSEMKKITDCCGEFLYLFLLCVTFESKLSVY
ncbi:unnamed protein product [Onchocerca flexuosa]|uniref:AH domain-containing protein n=1 Tax=Onchocerca flexuosa TaxID=387005 RepID=A0A183HFY3_9BILA|nr:unnamed protein product [Onchocerca flexuosa]